MISDQQNVEIRSAITGEIISVELSDTIPHDIMAQFYEALKHMRLKGPIMTKQREDKLLTARECKDYADDFLYDEQQCQLYFSKRLWEDFNLQDAAFFLSYLHVFPTLSFYSALPFMFEIALRGDKWCDSFYSLVSKLRKDAKNIDVDLWKILKLEAAQAIVEFLEMFCVKAEKLEKTEDVTVINRTITLWKTNMQQIFEAYVNKGPLKSDR